MLELLETQWVRFDSNLGVTNSDYFLTLAWTNQLNGFAIFSSPDMLLTLLLHLLLLLDHG